MREQIAPHGGSLVDRVVADDSEGGRHESQQLPVIELNHRQMTDVEMIATGGFSPLEGFMAHDDYERVVAEMRLADGLPWPLPITLGVSAERAHATAPGDRLALATPEGTRWGIIDVTDVFQRDKTREAELVYNTTDDAHPGVNALHRDGDWCLGGPITLFELPHHEDFPVYRLPPAETRRIFRERGWQRVVGFQTRNPIHRAHEYLHKCVMETYDALLIHPVIGPTKDGDLPNDVRMKCYEVMIENYYPKNHVMLAAYPAAMRYAGPREAVFHALIRKNYGCTHFIVGRDHAGVGDYYDTYDAHRIFDTFDEAEIGITPLFFDHSFYCHRCESVASTKTCPHDATHHVRFSGTRVRQLLQAGEPLPKELTRPEVAEVMMEWAHGAQAPERTVTTA